MLPHRALTAVLAAALLVAACAGSDPAAPGGRTLSPQGSPRATVVGGRTFTVSQFGPMVSTPETWAWFDPPTYVSSASATLTVAPGTGEACIAVTTVGAPGASYRLNGVMIWRGPAYTAGSSYMYGPSITPTLVGEGPTTVTGCGGLSLGYATEMMRSPEAFRVALLYITPDPTNGGWSHGDLLEATLSSARP